VARDLKETGGTEARPVPAPASPGPAPPAAAALTQEHRGPALPHTAAPPPVPSCCRQPRLGSALPAAPSRRRRRQLRPGAAPCSGVPRGCSALRVLGACARVAGLRLLGTELCAPFSWDPRGTVSPSLPLAACSSGSLFRYLS